MCMERNLIGDQKFHYMYDKLCGKLIFGLVLRLFIFIQFFYVYNNGKLHGGHVTI
jgi:hypothetical protein